MMTFLAFAASMRLLCSAELPAWDWDAAVLPVRPIDPPFSQNRHRTTLYIYFSPECSHCTEAWPRVVDLARRTRNVGLEVGGIATYATTRPEITMFLEALGEDVPVWFDSTHAVAKPYAIKTVPQAILVDPDGTVQLFDELTDVRLHQVEAIARRTARTFR